MRTVAAVLAGGVGQRTGLGVPKQLLKIAGKTVIEHSVAAFSAAPEIDEIVVVMTPGRTGAVAELLARGGHHKVTRVIEVARPAADRRGGRSPRWAPGNATCSCTTPHGRSSASR